MEKEKPEYSYTEMLKLLKQEFVSIERINEMQSNYKKQIEVLLDKQKKYIRMNLQSFNEDMWKLKNPPKYKVGDSTKHGIIYSVVFCPGNDLETIEIFDKYKELRMVVYTPFPIKTHWSYVAIKKGSNKPFEFQE